MYRSVAIFGAGSIGNHLAFACRNREWRVDLIDIDPEALRRTQYDIYPGRYGKWDPKITLSETVDWDIDYDLVIIGTPPDSHIKIAIEAMSLATPKLVLIEKPLCPPSMAGYQQLSEARCTSGSEVFVGYNHNLTKNTTLVSEIIRNGDIGDVRSIDVRWLEHWGGIFAAHPWLRGPEDSYLGFWESGGGASLEHSHGVSLWNFMARISGGGATQEVTSEIDFVRAEGLNYDRTCSITLKTETGIVGSVKQDVITKPPEKSLYIYGEKGTIEWRAGVDGTHDQVVLKQSGKDDMISSFPWTRPGDFEPEIQHISSRLEGEKEPSPISLENGYQTMEIINAAHLASSQKQKINIAEAAKLSNHSEPRN